MNELQKVGTGKLKQDLIIADTTATATRTLWEGDVNMLLQNKSYQMNKLLVKSHLGKKHLSIASTGSTIEEIDDLQNVVTSPKQSSDDEEFYTAVNVVGVQQLEATCPCINCKKGIEASTEPLGVCDNCNTTQKMTTQRHSAKLFIANTLNQRIPLRA